MAFRNHVSKQKSTSIKQKSVSHQAHSSRQNARNEFTRYTRIPVKTCSLTLSMRRQQRADDLKRSIIYTSQVEGQPSVF
jgi:hypothetical protein